MIKKIKGIYKRLKLTDRELGLMEYKSKAWDDASQYVQLTKDCNYNDATNKEGVVLIRFVDSVNYTFTVDIKKLFKALHFTSDDVYDVIIKE